MVGDTGLIIALSLTILTMIGFQGCSRNEVLQSSPPAARFEIDPVSGTAPLLVNIKESSSGEIDAWNWDFGDSTSFRGKVPPPHTYDKAGTYHITLAVKGPGGYDTARTAVEVNRACVRPRACFTVDKTQGLAPVAIKFSADCSIGDIADYVWNFGDGGSSNEKNPTHTYSAAGSYTVSLTVAGPCGTNTITRQSLIKVSEEKVISVNFGNIGPYWPARIGGDCDYKGHGPNVFASVTLKVKNINQVWAEVYMHSKETQSDWTEAEGRWNVYLWTAPDGWNIKSLSHTYASCGYTDNDVYYDCFYYNMCNICCFGNSEGSDICGRELHDTNIIVYFKTQNVTIRKD